MKMARDHVTRRELLRASAGGALALGTAGLLAACGSSSSTSQTSASNAQPKRGGTIRGGLSGGSTAESLDVQNLLQPTMDARCFCLYNGLVELDLNSQPRLMLAEEITPNKDATEWTIRVKQGIEWHNGRTLDADDVIYSLRRIQNPKAPGLGAPIISLVDSKNAVKVDSRTVRLPCHAPFATFVSTMSQHNLAQVPVDFDPKKPIGTGAFKYQSFTPGQQSVFVRSPNYWETGLPYLDEVILTDYTDETSQVNALLSGQEDVIDKLSVDSVASIASGGAATVISNAASFNPFTMRVDQSPFNDARVRQAMRLIVDRPQMRGLVFGGHGLMGNDVFSPLDPLYDTSLPQRTQDLEQAKSLLRQAGRADLSVELVTSDIAQGVVGAAQLFAQQAKGAGVSVTLRQVDPTAFFGPNYLKWTFAQDYWPYAPYLNQVAFSFLPNSSYPETHWDDPAYTKLYNEASATLDDAKRTELAHELQMVDYTRGGYIISNFSPVIDGHRSNVHGVVPCNTGFSLSNDGFKMFWLS
jgi:peptide/nickel transport system substrate-binding protein